MSRVSTGSYIPQYIEFGPRAYCINILGSNDLNASNFLSRFSTNIFDQHSLISWSFISGPVAKAFVSKRPKRTEF